MKKRTIVGMALLVFGVLMLSGCASFETENKESETTTVTEETEDNKSLKENESEESGSEKSESDETADNKSEKTEVLSFVNAFEESFEVEINPDIQKHDYDFSYLSSSDTAGPVSGSNHKIREEFLTYKDDTYRSRMGIDVSYHQGNIDWQQVKETGIEFVFVRIGYRGYGEAGNIKADDNALSYIEGAKENGLDVGVYFYSQAINEEEAVEEAEFVLKQLNGMELELPIVYDPEHVLDDEARTDDVSGEQFTKNAVAFLNRIKESGYEPAIYANMLWEAFELDLTKLADYDIWYADYEPLPQTPYNFRYWQYSNTGNVSGIQGEVDLNLEFVH